MGRIIKLLPFVFYSILLLNNPSGAQDKKADNSPKFFGYIRADYQADFSTNRGEFLVKQARIGARGTVNEYAGYRIFVDFTRLGKLQTTSQSLDGTKVLTGATATFSDVLLDAEAILTPFKSLSFSAGQFKVPFSTDNLRGGADIDFINRPFLTNVAPGLRDVGVMATYSLKSSLPLELKAGLFNGAGQNKTENDKSTNYSLRASIQPVGGFSFSVNYYGGKSSGTDMGIYDIGFDYKLGNAFLSGEYGERNTETPAKEFKANSYFIYATYEINFEGDFLKAVVPAVRFETYDPDNTLADNEAERITIGASLQFAQIEYAQVRINYEKFDYKNGNANPDKLIIELQTRF